ncbi:uncharacterized protein [Anas platyrhynchos]|uniref:uncharacterized protein n=1 Tax=Anas platyrhynchos TaxID=8839 RepID=UPI003AF29BFC
MKQQHVLIPHPPEENTEADPVRKSMPSWGKAIEGSPRALPLESSRSFPCTQGLVELHNGPDTCPTDGRFLPGHPAGLGSTYLGEELQGEEPLQAPKGFALGKKGDASVEGESTRTERSRLLISSSRTLAIWCSTRAESKCSFPPTAFLSTPWQSSRIMTSALRPLAVWFSGNLSQWIVKVWDAVSHYIPATPSTFWPVAAPGNVPLRAVGTLMAALVVDFSSWQLAQLQVYLQLLS